MNYKWKKIKEQIKQDEITLANHLLKVSNQIEDNFVLEESNLFRCKGCSSTFESENECNRHLEDLEKCSL